jgi:hypothetical protein
MSGSTHPKSVKVVIIGNGEPKETRLFMRMFVDWESRVASTPTVAEIRDSFLPAHLQRRT